MRIWAYAEKNDEAYRLYSFEDRQPVPADGEVQAVMMSRPDFDVRVVQIPAVREQEIESFLRYRIRALYPGQPEETAFDYQVLGRNGQRLAVLFLTRRSTLEAYRNAAQGRPLFLPFNLFRSLCARRGEGRRGFAFWHDTWIDVMVSTKEEPCRSVVLKRSAEPARDLERLRELMPPGEQAGEWRLLCPRSQCDDLRQAARSLEEAGYRVTVAALQDVAAGLGRLGRLGGHLRLGRLGKPAVSLFVPRKPRRLPGLSIRLQVYAALLLLLSVLVLRRYTEREVRYMSELQRTLGEAQGFSARTTALADEVAALEARLGQLRARRPPDPYRVLSELQRLLPEGTHIESFVMEKRRFQLEAVGSNPLALMEGFQGSALLESVKLTQIVPLPDSGRELFKITGGIGE